MIQITGKHLIAGTESQKGSPSFNSVNPRTRQHGEIPFSDATDAEIDRAVIAAESAFRETHNYAPSRLADFLDRVALEIESLGEQLLVVADEETGLGLPRLSGERGRTTGQLRKFGSMLREGSYVEAVIDTAQPNRKPAPRPAIKRMLIPLGPVAVFSASNFPFAFAVAGGDTASAFAAGCPVIVKGHPGHPQTSELFGRAINKAIDAMDFPPGYFSLLQGESIDVGQHLVTHPGVTAIGFTGSLRAGRAIYNAAAARPLPIPVYAEMGSINPVFILPGAIASRPQELADKLVGSLILGSGQFCTNPGLILVIDNPESENFIQLVTGKMAEAQAGVLLNEHIERGLDLAVGRTMEKESITLLTGGEMISGSPICYANTVMQTSASSFRADPDLQAEHFGPVTLFVVTKSEEDLIQTADFLEGNLTATIHATDDELELTGLLFDRLKHKAGRLILNGFPTGVEVTYAMQHGGPYPATTAPGTTSVGMMAIKRFLRPVAYQGLPDQLLPEALHDHNPLGIWRIVDEQFTSES
jgi:NADP-dependent aldehyde dehydrogenase